MRDEFAISVLIQMPDFARNQEFRSTKKYVR